MSENNEATEAEETSSDRRVGQRWYDEGPVFRQESPRRVRRRACRDAPPPSARLSRLPLPHEPRCDLWCPGDHPGEAARRPALTAATAPLDLRVTSCPRCAAGSEPPAWGSQGSRSCRKSTSCGSTASDRRSATPARCGSNLRHWYPSRRLEFVVRAGAGTGRAPRPAGCRLAEAGLRRCEPRSLA